MTTASSPHKSISTPPPPLTAKINCGHSPVTCYHLCPHTLLEIQTDSEKGPTCSNHLLKYWSFLSRHHIRIFIIFLWQGFIRAPPLIRIWCTLSDGGQRRQAHLIFKTPIIFTFKPYLDDGHSAVKHRVHGGAVFFSGVSCTSEQCAVLISRLR